MELHSHACMITLQDDQHPSIMTDFFYGSSIKLTGGRHSNPARFSCFLDLYIKFVNPRLAPAIPFV